MADKSMKPEIQWVHQRPSGNKSTTGLESNVDDGATYALRVVTRYSDRGLPETTSLTINSPQLRKILKSVARNHPSAATDFESPFEIEKPYQLLFHHWEEIHEKYKQDGTTDNERMHVKLLLKFMAQEMDQDKQRVESMGKSGRITFATLWTLFRPGDLVYIPDISGKWLLRLSRTAYDENKQVGKYMDVYCRYNDYDGIVHGQTEYTVRIIQKLKFPGEQPSLVHSLPIFPFSLLAGQEEIKDSLVEGGKRFCALQGKHVKCYQGVAWHAKDVPLEYFDPSYYDEPTLWEGYIETGRVVLDKKTFIDENWGDRISLSPQDTNDRSQLMLFPPYTHGYSLVLKQWCKFSVDNITETHWDESALDNVIVEEHRKEVMKSLVLAHEFPLGDVDLFTQKGKGLVVLLYGSPGSGKTMTAESLAEVAKKPLIRVTMGELNQHDSHYYFERALRTILKLATTWQAVVLLDEADVFFEGRSDNPGAASEHNALVAVLLKHLEYFSGIIFLTSNLVRVFDTAMKSRIHLALEYHPPDYEMMRRIWANAVSAVPEAERELDLDQDIGELLADNLNGREIANCVHTSRTLARYEKTKLRRDHIEKVLKAKRMFEKSFREIQAKARAVELGPIARRNTFEMADAE